MSNNFKTSLDLNLRFLLYFLTSLMKTNNKSLNINFSQTIETSGSFNFPRGSARGSQKVAEFTNPV